MFSLNASEGHPDHFLDSMRKLLVIVVLVSCAAAGLLFVQRRADPYHTTERREWKDQAVIAIGNDLKDPAHPEKRDAAEWLTKSMIICDDGSWLAYRSQCHKENPKIHDIFIAKASDGRWYYSDFHFCIGAVVLEMRGQPESLERFKTDYHLAEFDGVSDAALAPTWKK